MIYRRRIVRGTMRSDFTTSIPFAASRSQAGSRAGECQRGVAHAALSPLLMLVVACAACNLVTPTTLVTPVPTPAIPQAKILFPAHNQQVLEGVIFDIEILASDPGCWHPAR